MHVLRTSERSMDIETLKVHLHYKNKIVASKILTKNPF